MKPTIPTNYLLQATIEEGLLKIATLLANEYSNKSLIQTLVGLTALKQERDKYMLATSLPVKPKTSQEEKPQVQSKAKGWLLSLVLSWLSQRVYYIRLCLGKRRGSLD